MYRDSRRLRLLLAMLMLVSFTLITIDYRSSQGGVLGALRRGAVSVFGPVQRAVTSVVRPIGNALSTIGDLGSVKAEAERLRKENSELRERLHETDDLRRRVAEIDATFQLAGRGGFRVVPARVVAESMNNFEWIVTIDAGSADQVVAGQTVINGDGLVGRVLDTTTHEARVLLALDASFSVAARVARSGCIGTLTGDGLGPMRLELIQPEAKVDLGQPVVTGPGGSFVAGVPIGSITDISRPRRALTKTLLITPYVRFGALDVLGVVLEATRGDARDSVLPPAPSLAASPAPAASGSPSTAPAAPPASPTGSPSPTTVPTALPASC